MTNTHARQASEQLVRALIDLARKGIRPRCGDGETSHYWTSEQEAERGLAAIWCTGCPVLEPCGQSAIANDEHWGVWGGMDMSIRPGRAKRSKQTGDDDGVNWSTVGHFTYTGDRESHDDEPFRGKSKPRRAQSSSPGAYELKGGTSYGVTVTPSPITGCLNSNVVAPASPSSSIPTPLTLILLRLG